MSKFLKPSSTAKPKDGAASAKLDTYESEELSLLAAKHSLEAAKSVVIQDLHYMFSDEHSQVSDIQFKRGVLAGIDTSLIVVNMIITNGEELKCKM